MVKAYVEIHRWDRDNQKSKFTAPAGPITGSDPAHASVDFSRIPRLELYPYQLSSGCGCLTSDGNSLYFETHSEQEIAGTDEGPGRELLLEAATVDVIEGLVKRQVRTVDRDVD